MQCCGGSPLGGELLMLQWAVKTNWQPEEEAEHNLLNPRFSNGHITFATAVEVAEQF